MDRIQYSLVAFVLCASPAFAQATATEQILQSTLGVCVGDNARTLVALQEAQKRIAELEAKLKEKADETGTKQ